MAETESEGIGDIHNYLQHFNPKDVGGVVISKTEVIGEKLKKKYCGTLVSGVTDPD